MICGDLNKYDEIRNWILCQFQDTKKYLSFDNLIFVIGKSGIGKTHNIKNICNELNLHTIYITSSNCSSSTELQDILIKNLTSSMVQILTNDTKNKIIIIDELETLITLDKNINTMLYGLLNNGKMKKTPIICISSIDNMNKMGNIKKKCKIFELNEPNENDILSLMMSLFPNQDEKKLMNIIESCGSNIEQCIKKISSKNSFNNMDEIMNISLFYGNTFDRELLCKTILSDQLIPSIIHENLVFDLNNRKCSINDKHQFYKSFLNYLIIYDVFKQKNVDISSAFFVSMIYPLTKLKKKKENIKQNQNNTKKNMKEIYSNTFPLNQISNYHINIIGRKYIFFK